MLPNAITASSLPDWVLASGAIVLAILVGLAAHAIVFGVIRRVARGDRRETARSVARHLNRPAQLLLPLLALDLALPLLPLAPRWLDAAAHTLALALIAGAAWLVVALLYVAEDAVARRYTIDVADNLRARQVRTQTQLLRRVAMVVTVVIALAAMLMTFPAIRSLGVSLFASAGIAGLIAGMAARPTLSSLIAGVQIALTEPIRIDDVVIVDGEWGRVEEIRTTYVVVRIWDLRRLVVPLSYFIEQPFQNWTRTTAQLLGTVFLYVDYTVPVQAVRQELQRVLEGTDLWDHQTWGLQVTDSKERTVELRALMSAADAGKAWDLRCLVREKMIDFLQREYPDALPRVRARIESGKSASSP